MSEYQKLQLEAIARIMAFYRERIYELEQLRLQIRYEMQQESRPKNAPIPNTAEGP